MRKRAHVDAGRFSNAVRNFEGGFLQDTPSRRDPSGTYMTFRRSLGAWNRSAASGVAAIARTNDLTICGTNFFSVKPSSLLWRDPNKLFAAQVFSSAPPIGWARSAAAQAAPAAASEIVCAHHDTVRR